jgi:hypothetical protein
MSHLLRRAIPFGIALLAACDGGSPARPADPLPRTIIEGDYALAAEGETVSNAWEKYTVRVAGTVRLEQDHATPSKISGTFRNLREESIGYPDDRVFDGVVSGSIDSSGRLVLELSAASAGFTWTGRGQLVDASISGQWMSSHPAAGGFTAQLVR